MTPYLENKESWKELLLWHKYIVISSYISSLYSHRFLNGLAYVKHFMTITLKSQNKIITHYYTWFVV